MTIQIRVSELQKAVDRVGDVFVTRDVSEQEELQRAHPSDASDRYWHQNVGKAISAHRHILGVDLIKRTTSRGARWQKTAGASRSIAKSEAPLDFATPPAEDPQTPHDLGPQYSGDHRFTARLRLHQSFWRATELKVPCGTGPMVTSTSRYGNMLDRAAGEAGKNFLTPEIFAVARARLAESGGAIEPFRLLRNLLSSQPMCFNLFGPLVRDQERAARLLRPLFGDLAKVRKVAIEWAPSPASSYLDDRTAFDAMIEYERNDGALILVGIETKLTDSFSQKPYDRESYRRWMRARRSPFREEAWDEVQKPRHNQLWRNHLLALAARDIAGSPYREVKSMVVYHPGDEDCARVVESYRELLKEGDETFAARTLDEVIASFESAAESEERAWLASFRKRYLALELSEGIR